jgi:hypothetical protein
MITQKADNLFIFPLQPDNIINNFAAEVSTINKIADENQSVFLFISANIRYQCLELFQTSVNFSYGKNFIHKTSPKLCDPAT